MYGPTSVFLPGGRFAAACQLGDRFGRLPELRADLAVVVGPGARPGRQWTAVAGRAGRAPFRDGMFDLIAVDNPSGIRQPLEPVLQGARRLCRSTGSLLIGSHAGLLERLRPSGSRRRERAVVLTALPSLRRPAFLADAPPSLLEQLIGLVLDAWSGLELPGPPPGWLSHSWSGTGGRRRARQTRLRLQPPGRVRGLPGAGRLRQVDPHRSAGAPASGPRRGPGRAPCLQLTVEETIRQQAAYRALEQLVPDFLPIDLTDRDDRAMTWSP